MKLILNGVELDATKEHELIAKNENLGFKVEIKYTPESWYTEKNEINNNVTEVHHLFNKHPIMGADKRIAIESDIHGTGFHRDINDIVSVTIEDALFVADEF